MYVTKGLIIDEPWIGHILSGAKTWEMRSTAASFRGWFGLIRKGSGAVVGIARLVDVGSPLSPEEMIRNFEKHRIPEEMIRSGEIAKWNTPWILADVRRLPRSVAYRHRAGAVTWVELDEDVSVAIAASLGEGVPAAHAMEPAAALSDGSAARAASPVAAIPVMPASARMSASGMWGEVELTEGNIKNNHFYMRSFIHRFPTDLIGGRDRSPPRLATIDADGLPSTQTDICPRHRFFRDRSWTRVFFAHNGAEPGDIVRVEETGPYRYRVSLRKR